MKAVWCSLNALFYGLRPGIVFPKSVSESEVLNWVAQIAFNASIWYMGGAKAMAYLLLGLFFSKFFPWHNGFLL
jgi:sphingolipid delta-4 desaturase